MPRDPKPRPALEPAEAAALAASIVRKEVPAFADAIETAKGRHTTLITSIEELSGMYAGDASRLADMLFMCLHYAYEEQIAVLLNPRGES